MRAPFDRLCAWQPSAAAFLCLCLSLLDLPPGCRVRQPTGCRVRLPCPCLSGLCGCQARPHWCSRQPHPCLVVPSLAAASRCAVLAPPITFNCNHIAASCLLQSPPQACVRGGTRQLSTASLAACGSCWRWADRCLWACCPHSRLGRSRTPSRTQALRPELLAQCSRHKKGAHSNRQAWHTWRAKSNCSQRRVAQALLAGRKLTRCALEGAVGGQQGRRPEQGLAPAVALPSDAGSAPASARMGPEASPASLANSMNEA